MKKKVKLTEESTIKIQSAIFTSFVASHYLNEIKDVYFKNKNDLPIPIIKGKDKLLLNKTLESLIRIERELFNPMDNDKDGEKINDAFINHLLDFTKFMVEGKTYYQFAELQSLCLSYGINRDKIMTSAMDIIEENAKNSK